MPALEQFRCRDWDRIEQCSGNPIPISLFQSQHPSLCTYKTRSACPLLHRVPDIHQVACIGFVTAMLDVVLLAVTQYKRIFDKMGEQYGVAYPGDVFPLLAARCLQGSAPSLDERMTGSAWHNNILSRPDANEKNDLCRNRRQQIAQTRNALLPQCRVVASQADAGISKRQLDSHLSHDLRIPSSRPASATAP